MVTEMVALATLALAAVATPAALVTAACLGRRRHGRLSRRNRRRRSTHLRHAGHHGLWGAVLQSGRRFLLWLYWDPECGKGISSWLIDNEAPSTTAVSDLDGDGSCSIILCVPKIQRLVLASTGPRHVANILQLRVGGHGRDHQPAGSAPAAVARGTHVKYVTLVAAAALRAHSCRPSRIIWTGLRKQRASQLVRS